MTTAIGILARAPVPGACKTRLIPAIGADGAAQLQRALIGRTLTTACAAAADRVVLFTDGDTGDGLWDALRRQHPIDIAPQCGPDLGARMAHAMQALLAHHARAILVGTDCLTLHPGTLQAAAAALAQARMVFVPAEDGGYALVGATAFPARVFGDLAWGTRTVMADTRERLRGAGWAPDADWIELDTGWDIDRPADLQRAVTAGLIDAAWLAGLGAPATPSDGLRPPPMAREPV